MITNEEATKILTDADPAHPVALLTSGKTATHLGLSKREWFAGMALQGLCSHYGAARDVREHAIDAQEIADSIVELLKQKS